MKIIYDEQIFSNQKYGGISRYFCNLIENSKINSSLSAKIATVFSKNEYLNSLYSRKIVGQSIIKYEGSYFVNHSINRLYSILILLFYNYDLFIPTYYNPYFIKYLKKDKPFVLTVHDMIDEFYPQMNKYNNRIVRYKKICIENATKIIAISENTKNDIIKFYPNSSDKIIVIMHGYQQNKNIEVKFDENFTEKYVLFVGNRDSYKNFSFMIENLAAILIEFKINLYCIGGGGWKIDEINMFDNLNITNNCFQINADEASVNMYYKKALFFIYPSEYEGFGLPILEAFANDCPVLLSNASCFPEIAGDSALYFELNNSEDFKNKVIELIRNKDKREHLISLGKKKLIEYSIEKCCLETFLVYQSVVKK